MTKLFLNRLITEAKRMKAEAHRVRWQDVLSAVVGPQNDVERMEVERAGAKSLAKWATKAIKPKQGELWADGSIQDAEGARVALFDATLEEYDWQIKHLKKAIAGFTRALDKVIAARAALVQYMAKK